MSLLIANTTIAVLRVEADPERDPYDEQPEPDEVASAVRAHIAVPRGDEHRGGGSQEIVDFVLQCDPVDLLNTDQVKDELTDEVYDVVWARTVRGYGLDHTIAGLRQVRGVV